MTFLGNAAELAEIDLHDRALDEVKAALMHLEDLDVFVGQRSRMHPGLGWETALALVRRDLALLQGEVARRTPFSAET